MNRSDPKGDTEDLRKQAINLHVGRRIRLRREDVGLSRTDLANLLRVTTQQIAKYENGSNTVKADRLYDIAKSLHVEPAYFFEDLNVEAAEPELFRKHERAYIRRMETRRLLRIFETIETTDVRKRILNLVRAIAKSDVVETSNSDPNG